jgi:hypothetical protein
MECYKICDNLGHNLRAQEAIAALSCDGRAALDRCPGGLVARSAHRPSGSRFLAPRRTSD